MDIMKKSTDFATGLKNKRRSAKIECVIIFTRNIMEKILKGYNVL